MQNQETLYKFLSEYPVLRFSPLLKKMDLRGCCTRQHNWQQLLLYIVIVSPEERLVFKKTLKGTSKTGGGRSVGKNCIPKVQWRYELGKSDCI